MRPSSSRNGSRCRLRVSVGSTAVAVADRGAVSRTESSPKKSPVRTVAMIASSPSGDGRLIFTAPDATTWSASPGSPWWKITSPAAIPMPAQVARQVREIGLGHAGEERAAAEQGGVAAS